MRLPNTYIIGVQKAGTTSLHHWIAQHPEVYGPNAFKDVDYFCNPEISDKAEKRLTRDFSGHQNEPIVLQTYVNYILYEESLKNIKSLVPEAKIIAILRDPVERALSAYKYFKKMGREKRSIDKVFDYKLNMELLYSQDNNDFTYLEHGMYGAQLEKVYSLFESSNVLILNFNELKEKPNEVCRTVFEFLNIDSSFLPSFNKKNQTGSLKSKRLQKGLTTTSSQKRKAVKYLIDWWLPKSKKKQLKNFLFEINTQKENKKDDIPENIKEKLKKVFHKDQEKLKTVLNEK